MSNKTLGAAGEAHAAAHLERLGYRVLARRYRTRFGELDIVVTDGSTIVFVEVKARRGGDPWVSLHEAKRLQVRRMAAAWLTASTGRRPHAAELRFDAVAVTLDADGGLVALEHLEDAF